MASCWCDLPNEMARACLLINHEVLPVTFIRLKYTSVYVYEHQNAEFVGHEQAHVGGGPLQHRGSEWAPPPFVRLHEAHIDQWWLHAGALLSSWPLRWHGLGTASPARQMSFPSACCWQRLQRWTCPLASRPLQPRTHMSSTCGKAAGSTPACLPHAMRNWHTSSAGVPAIQPGAAQTPGKS